MMEQHKLEILRMAKDMVFNEYWNVRNQIHENWLRESDRVWKEKRQLVPYPDIPPYPSGDEILECAGALICFCLPEPPPETLPSPEPMPLPPEGMAFGRRGSLTVSEYVREKMKGKPPITNLGDNPILDASMRRNF